MATRTINIGRNVVKVEDGKTINVTKYYIGQEEAGGEPPATNAVGKGLTQTILIYRRSLIA